MKERLTRHTLQLYFGGQQLKDFGVFSALGEGLTVTDNDNNVPAIGELVNCKRGKRKRKGHVQ